MSDNKKYYYLKLKDNYFNADNIRIIEGMENGYIYSLIILKLYIKSCKYDGRLMMTERIPYDPDKLDTLAKVINHDIAHVKETIKLGCELDLITILDSGQIWMNEIQNFIGHSSTEADRKRKYRLKISMDKCPDKNPPEKEKEKEKELKKEKKNKYRDNIYLTLIEYEKLLKKYGEDQLDSIFDKLDNYKGSKGKKYKSDYKAILLWVVDAVKAEPIKQDGHYGMCEAEIEFHAEQRRKNAAS